MVWRFGDTGEMYEYVWSMVSFFLVFCGLGFCDTLFRSCVFCLLGSSYSSTLRSQLATYSYEYTNLLLSLHHATKILVQHLPGIHIREHTMPQ